jgi:hypothetical protein
VAIGLIGESVSHLDPELIRQAAAGVLHYFREELGRESVSVAEFSEALAKVLRGFGLQVAIEEPGSAQSPCGRVVEADLRRLACDCGKGFELAFFPRLRDELKGQLRESPRMLRFTGLRGCVKQLAGAQRWSGRCQQLNDHIIDYLRRCLGEEARGQDCAMVVL